MRLPTFSRQTDRTAETEELTPVAGTNTSPGTTPVRQRTDPPTVTPPPASPPTVVERREPKTADLHSRDLKPPAGARRADSDEPTLEHKDVTDRPVLAAGPKPRASLLATVGLILSIVAALLVLSGPLLGYGIGVAVLALVLSLGGISATRKRHVAGKTDALIGMVVSLAAVVVGVLALTGSLSWLGTDMQPVNSLREWLDTQFVDRF